MAILVNQTGLELLKRIPVFDGVEKPTEN